MMELSSKITAKIRAGNQTGYGNAVSIICQCLEPTRVQFIHDFEPLPGEVHLTKVRSGIV
jgi:hypothetical protein